MNALFNISSIYEQNNVQIRQTINLFQMNIQALKSLKESTDSWDSVLIYWLSAKLDNSRRSEWENYNTDTKNSHLGILYSVYPDIVRL